MIVSLCRCRLRAQLDELDQLTVTAAGTALDAGSFLRTQSSFVGRQGDPHSAAFRELEATALRERLQRRADAHAQAVDAEAKVEADSKLTLRESANVMEANEAVGANEMADHDVECRKPLGAAQHHRSRAERRQQRRIEAGCSAAA